jgi:hypothetical protein
MARWAVVAVLLVGVLAAGSSARGRKAPVRAGLTAEQRRGGLTYDASVDPASRSAIEAAIAAARPEARRLIDVIDGATVVSIGNPPLAGALGSTQGMGDHFEVVLDLGETQRVVGNGRGVTRLVLHELGHVVDRALVPPALAAKLDAEIPAGAPCPAGTPLGSCAPREERFAETFAKWAMGNDLGADLYIGYAVPPPPMGFDAWAAPLADLAK